VGRTKGKGSSGNRPEGKRVTTTGRGKEKEKGGAKNLHIEIGGCYIKSRVGHDPCRVEGGDEGLLLCGCLGGSLRVSQLTLVKMGNTRIGKKNPAATKRNGVIEETFLAMPTRRKKREIKKREDQRTFQLSSIKGLWTRTAWRKYAGDTTKSHLKTSH